MNEQITMRRNATDEVRLVGFDLDDEGNQINCRYASTGRKISWIECLNRAGGVVAILRDGESEIRFGASDPFDALAVDYRTVFAELGLTPEAIRAAVK